MRTEQVICYTCRFCKIDCRGGSLYCSLRKKGGQCIGYDNWESKEDVLDKIRAEIEGCEDRIRSSRDYDKAEYVAYTDAITDVLVILDKYKTESEEKWR